MKTIKSAALTALLVAMFTISSDATKLLGPDVGNWTVGDCILAQFAMEFTVYTNSSNLNATMTVDVPADAKVNGTSTCQGEHQTQTLTLVWSEVAKNDTTVSLNRAMTVIFSTMPNDTFYGVSRMYAKFTYGVWMVNDTRYESVITIDSGDVAKLMFHTPLDRSFLCADLGQVDFKSVLRYPNSPPDGTKLPNATISAKRVQFDAFRVTEKAPPGFRTPMDCDYKPNDIVPIAVGVALALLVVTVLISYLVGRRRHRQQGYQSV